MRLCAGNSRAYFQRTYIIVLRGESDAQADKLEMYNIFESSLVSYSKFDEEEPWQLASLSDCIRDCWSVACEGAHRIFIGCSM